MEKKNKCTLCDLKPNDQLRLYGIGPIDTFSILESDNFIVKPDILPANPDGRHFLVFPKYHRYNFASFGGNQKIINELGRLIYQMEQRFGPLTIFEHGGIQEGSNVQSIYHAHFHAIGGLENKNVIQWMADVASGALDQKETYPYRILPAPNYDFLSNLQHRFNGHPYLYVEQGPNALYIEDPNNQMRSQLTQRAIQTLITGVFLNWKEISQNEEAARESARRLANCYALCTNGQYNPHRF